MKILVDRLTTEATSFRYEGDAAWWRAAMPAEHDLPREILEPFAFDLCARLMGEDLYLEGRVVGALELECSRCLARYRHGFREVFRLILEPAGNRTPVR